MLPDAIEKFITLFSKLPSIGPRMARRLAFYLIALDRQTFANIENAFGELKKLDRCPRCFFIKDIKSALCPICADAKRDKKTVAVVEKETDLISIEQVKKFRGMYLVLGESEGAGLGSSQKLRLQHLKRIAKEELGGALQEIIIAMSPTTRGDFLANIIKQELRDVAKRITRLGRGIPTGGDVEFADEETLGSAFEHRK